MRPTKCGLAALTAIAMLTAAPARAEPATFCFSIEPDGLHVVVACPPPAPPPAAPGRHHKGHAK